MQREHHLSSTALLQHWNIRRFHVEYAWLEDAWRVCCCSAMQILKLLYRTISPRKVGGNSRQA